MDKSQVFVSGNRVCRSGNVLDTRRLKGSCFADVFHPLSGDFKLPLIVSMSVGAYVLPLLKPSSLPSTHHFKEIQMNE